ncbi:MAG: hypothetical protein Kow002_02260 [Anaerolineales bacterium]
MYQIKHFTFLRLVIIAFMLFSITWAIPVSANHLHNIAMTNTKNEEIQEVIYKYFEIRYSAFNTLQLGDFNNIVSSQPDARAFLETELGKLEVEIKHLAVNQLRYVEYEFFLDFTDITINAATQTAIVSVSVSHDVIHEISAELEPDNPVVSHSYNIDHTILLGKEQGQWKIISDNYADYLWRMIKQTGITTDEMLHNIEPIKSPSLRSTNLQETFSCNLPVDDSTHEYNRQGAADYALEHIDREDYNPNYPDYNGDPTNPWGDCTNFVSQALYEGGNISMAFCDQNGLYCSYGSDGNLGWFFDNADFRASAWTHVGKFYEFVLDRVAEEQYGWTEGPEGCEVNSIAQLDIGDVIQYKWDNDDIWDHAVIVVEIVGGVPYVASHSDDVGPVPYTGPDYFGNFQDIRFIHIERSDGYDTSPTATPTIEPTATITTIPGSRGFYPDGIHVTYYNDVAPAEIFLDEPINWQTFTTWAAEEDVPYINFNWGTTSPAPGVNAVFWSAIYEGQLLVPQDGEYKFYLENLDDGGRLYIDANKTNVFEDHEKIIESWKVQGPHSYDANIYLAAGQYPIKIEYAQGPGNEGSLTVAWEMIGGFSKEIIGPASAATSTPGPTPTPISGTPVTPPPTQVSLTPSTPVPTTPAPPYRPPWCDICNWGCPNANTARSSLSLPGYYGTPTPSALTTASSRLAQAVDLTTLLYRVRDEILSQTPEGQRLRAQYYESIPQIVEVLMADRALSEQSYATMQLFVPGLQALVDGNGDSVVITSEQVAGLQSFLDTLIEQGAPELREVITSELEHRPLSPMIGMTMNEAWEYLNGYQLEWLRPVSNNNPYEAKAGSVIPIQFRLTDSLGNFITDESLTIELVNENGEVVIGPVALGDNPANGIVIQNRKYHFNLRTKNLKAGLYTLEVTYHAVNPGVPYTWKINLIRKK